MSSLLVSTVLALYHFFCALSKISSTYYFKISEQNAAVSKMSFASSEVTVTSERPDAKLVSTSWLVLTVLSVAATLLGR